MTNNRDIQELKSYTTQDIAKMEGQIGQLANQVGERERERRKFPSQPVPNSKGQFGIGNSPTPTHGKEHVQVITTLRLGKQMDNQVATLEEASDIASEEENQAKATVEVEPDRVIPSVEIQEVCSQSFVLYIYIYIYICMRPVNVASKRISYFQGFS